MARTREAHRAYLEAKRDWLLDLEARTLKRRPDLDSAVRNRFRLQLLYDERAALRLEYLLVQKPSQFDAVNSLSEISQQVDKGWGDDDNTAASALNPRYRDIEEEIGRLKTLENPSIGEPLAAVENTPEYAQRLQALKERMRAIDVSLGKATA